MHCADGKNCSHRTNPAIAPSQSLNLFYLPTWHSPSSESSQSSQPLRYFAEWYRCCNRFESQQLCKAACLCHRVATTVVGEPFNGLWGCCICTKSILNSLHHQITHQSSIDAFGGGHQAHDFSVATVQSKRHSHVLTIVTKWLQTI